MVTGQVRSHVPRPQINLRLCRPRNSQPSPSVQYSEPERSTPEVELVHSLPACLGTPKVGGGCLATLHHVAKGRKRRQNCQAPLVYKQAQPVSMCPGAVALLVSHFLPSEE